MSAVTADREALVAAWKDLERDGVRRRDGAERLGVSEARIVAALAASGEATALKPQWRSILEHVPQLGPVMALTRNDACVIEKVGTYHSPQFSNDSLGQVTGPEIDLRLFLQHWVFGFAVSNGEHASFEFFGADGRAVHKIHSRKETDQTAWSALISSFASVSKFDELTTEPDVRQSEVPDSAVDVDAYRAALSKMQNTHDFFGVVRRFKLTREQALRLGGDAFAVRVPTRSYSDALYLAAERDVSIMAFVGNRGVIQIHTGPVHRIVERAGFFNVLDKTFNLHLLESKPRTAWVVRKPTSSGIVSSLEIYDEFGDLIVQFFGERHGEPEQPQWRAILSEIAP
jgi:putative hemin transport protein